MDFWYIVSIILFVIFLISLPVYIIFLIAVAKYRKHHPFNSSFFTICFVMGIIDIMSLLRTWIFVRFPRFGWFGLDVIVKRYPEALAKFAYISVPFLSHSQFNLIFVMALNRYSALVTPFLYKQKWKKKYCIKHMIASTLIPGIVCVPQLFTGHDYIINNQTGIIEGTKMMDYNWLAFQVAYFLYLIGTGAVLSSATGVIYCILFWKRHQQLLKRSTKVDSNEQRENRSDLKYAFVGLSLLAAMTASMTTTWLMAFGVNDPATKYFYFNLMQTSYDVLGWINLWTLLAFCKRVRERMVSTLKWIPQREFNRVKKEKIKAQVVTPAVKYCPNNNLNQIQIL